jgi:NAD(P)-dependent dehydrogenase (short-subunit alcohol dehydrogenase family)
MTSSFLSNVTDQRHSVTDRPSPGECARSGGCDVGAEGAMRPFTGLGHNDSMDLHLTGKVVLITGGTDGLGAALADRLIEEGARVAVCGRDPDRLDATEQRLRGAGGDALGVQADVTNLSDLERFVDAAVARWGRLDGLVNNAGKSAAGRIDQVSDDEWTADLNLKVLAAARLTRLAVRHLIAAGGGAIVNVLNVGAKAAGAASLPTTASRAAGLAITKAASKDLGGLGIRVNAVLIGLVESGQWRRRADAAGQSEDEYYRQMAQNSSIPLGRVGRPEEFADLAAYLLSDRSSYVTGSAINLDGGTSPVL